MVTGDAALLAALLVQDERGAASLALEVSHAHAERCSDSNEAEEHHADQRAIAKGEERPRPAHGAVELGEEAPGFLALEHGRLALTHDEAGRPQLLSLESADVGVRLRIDSWVEAGNSGLRQP